MGKFFQGVFWLQNGSHLSSGRDTAVMSGKDIHVSASDINAKGNVALGAQGDITIDAKADEMEYHLRTKNTKVDMQTSVAVGSSIKSGGVLRLLRGRMANRMISPSRAVPLRLMARWA